MLWINRTKENKAIRVSISDHLKYWSPQNQSYYFVRVLKTSGRSLWNGSLTFSQSLRGEWLWLMNHFTTVVTCCLHCIKRETVLLAFYCLHFVWFRDTFLVHGNISQSNTKHRHVTNSNSVCQIRSTNSQARSLHCSLEMREILIEILTARRYR